MFFTILFLILTFFILTQSETSLYYAFYGFSLWYSKMIPSLLPFMIISGILVRMNLTESFANLLHPLLKRFYHCSKNATYVIIMGFLCGFPMGAKVVAELLKSKKITEKEGQYLLCFCNNIGPVYFCSFVIPLLQISKPLPYLFGMYGIPLLYGIILQHTIYKRELAQIEQTKLQNNKSMGLLSAMDESIHASIQSILMLCGYMILFNLINILPHFMTPGIHKYIAPFLEITGGLSMLQGTFVPFCMSMLTFGGLSCIAQTSSCTSHTGPVIGGYVRHKLILTILTGLYYLFCLRFLRLW